MNTSPSAPLIQIFSDPICPWCYIGHQNFSTALATYPRSLPELTLNWRTFMLNPAMPDGGMDRQDYLNRKFGGAQAAQSVYGRIDKAGVAAGLNMKLGGIQRTPETRSAHQVIQAVQADAQLAPLTTAFVHRLFRAYFDEGQDIGEASALDQQLMAVGGPPGFASTTLDEGAFKANVMQEDQENRARGLTGVPGFLILNEHFVGGAQPVNVFHRFFDIIAEETFTNSAVADA